MADRYNWLQVFRAQPCFPGDLCEEAGTNFFVVVEGERIVGRSRPLESTMRPTLPSDCPSDSDQCRQESFRLHRWPTAHAMENTFSNCGGTSSPWSMQSAATRRASARTAKTAASRVGP